MPKGIIFVGLVFCAMGVLSVVEVVDFAQQGKLYLSFSVLMLPVGIGLLQGKARSWRWAKFWVGLGYVICALFLLIILVVPNSLTYDGFGQQLEGADARIPGLIGLVVAVAGLTLMLKLLSSIEATRFFGNAPDSPEALRARQADGPAS